jgi:hypothetical protein
LRKAFPFQRVGYRRLDVAGEAGSPVAVVSRRRITHTDWEADRARETAIPAMVITMAAVAGTAAVNFLSAIRR